MDSNPGDEMSRPTRPQGEPLRDASLLRRCLTAADLGFAAAEGDPTRGMSAAEGLEEARTNLEGFLALEPTCAVPVPRHVWGRIEAALEQLRSGRVEIAHVELQRAGSQWEAWLDVFRRPDRPRPPRIEA
jgi:hypothetical protein